MLGLDKFRKEAKNEVGFQPTECDEGTRLRRVEELGKVYVVKPYGNKGRKSESASAGHLPRACIGYRPLAVLAPDGLELGSVTLKIIMIAMHIKPTIQAVPAYICILSL